MGFIAELRRANVSTNAVTVSGISWLWSVKINILYTTKYGVQQPTNDSTIVSDILIVLILARGIALESTVFLNKVNPSVQNNKKSFKTKNFQSYTVFEYMYSSHKFQLFLITPHYKEHCTQQNYTYLYLYEIMLIYISCGK